MGLTVTTKYVHYCQIATKKAIKRLNHERDPKIKALRKYNRVKKLQLRNRKEKRSEDTYCSDMTLLEKPANNDDIIKEVPNELTYNSDNIAFVFFNLETGGFSPQKDILQIAMKNETKLLSIYLTPRKEIDPQASTVTGLTKFGRQLFLHGELLYTVVHRQAALKVVEFLQSFDRKVLLIAHNCNFDAERIIRFFQRLDLLSSFEDLILGFTDTLGLFKVQFPDRQSHKLSDLGQEMLNLNIENAHNAAVDIDLLEKLTVKFISWGKIIAKKFSVQDVLNNFQMNIDEKLLSPTFNPLKSVMSQKLIKSLSRSKIEYNVIVEKFLEGKDNFSDLFMKGEKPFIQKQFIMNKIIDFMNELMSIIEHGIPKEIYSNQEL